MNDFSEAAHDYERVERAIRFIGDNAARRPSLEEVASAVGLSEFHFQRLFSRWAGISPKRFIQYLTKEHAKKLLENSAGLLDAAFESGLSGTSRLHDLLVTTEAVTPGEVRHRGEGLSISYGFHPSPFGTCLVAVTERGLCGLKFAREDRGEAELTEWLRKLWPAAELRRDETRTAILIPLIFSLPNKHPVGPLHLYVKGTNFQIQVCRLSCGFPSAKR
jgi:AraC family transcriptional regulator of adaptative response/methylated-DNA-[protein]-cysteine methyltransferase